MRAELAQSTANEQQVQVSAAQASSAGARVEQARANLAAAELNLGYTTIVAPVDGVVTKKSVEPGQIVQPGQSLMAIIPLKDVWVTANFKETQLANVHAGPEGRSRRGYVRPHHRGPRGFHRRRHRRAHQPAAARKRHRQLRQSGASAFP